MTQSHSTMRAKGIFLTALLLLPIATVAQKRIYEPQDSARCEQILRDSLSNKCSILYIAHLFIGEKYVAGTLEQGSEEPLTVSCTRLDCTTFIELVLALHITANEGDRNFDTLCRNLERVRYRNGKNGGYASRLHYISCWIADSAKTGIIEEVTADIEGAEKQLLHLDYMSKHPSAYPILAENPSLIKEIEFLEEPFRNAEAHYIPKRKLKRNGAEGIKEGDIIAIVTSIEGLDVAHVGFAHYNNGALCLLHASSEKGEVILDTRPLCDYLNERKRHIGIRVFRPTTPP